MLACIKYVVFDECSKIKNANAKRSKFAMEIAEKIRTKHNEKGIVILMSGTPAPRNPTDWYSITEVACPGFLKEGDIYKFRDRLGCIEQREGLAGQKYPHLKTWFDRPGLCQKCGEPEDSENHSPTTMNLDDTGDGLFATSLY